jgi:hypothetical protein
MPPAYALSGGIYFAQKPNRHAVFDLYNKVCNDCYIGAGKPARTEKKSKMNVYYTKATALELGFTFVADLKTNWLHLAKDGITQARCNSRYNVHATENGQGYDFECIKCNNIIAKALIVKAGE